MQIQFCSMYQNIQPFCLKRLLLLHIACSTADISNPTTTISILYTEIFPPTDFEDITTSFIPRHTPSSIYLNSSFLLIVLRPLPRLLQRQSASSCFLFRLAHLTSCSLPVFRCLHGKQQAGDRNSRPNHPLPYFTVFQSLVHFSAQLQ